jgi:hypothetical protein
MTIRRAPSEVRTTFTIIPNVTINDDRLSWEAIGLLTFLLSKPDNWIISPTHLMKQRGAGRHRIYKVLNELEEAGYIRSEKVRDEGKFAGFDRVLYDVSNNAKVEEDVEPEPERSQRIVRKPDPLFESVLEVCYLDATRLTPSARGSINRAVKELREVGADSEMVLRAADEYRQRYATLTLTPPALAKHFPSLMVKTKNTVAAKPKNDERHCSACRGTGWCDSEDDDKTVLRCIECQGVGSVPV